ncbi:putative DNA-directed primase/polymerase protein [Hypsibius exemplaris]|uniref:DNA-directed primase/polymerase protein n=1 Tax=Hypsibius exemplaris TaxID=2072580 RepID=A0A1W0WLH3_HYPEX|nr:putative DNA-directed primase/polymerase protein [Hypsibius exemplaris]
METPTAVPAEFGETDEYKLFHKQEEALDYCSRAGRNHRIFSRERKIGGSRVHHVYPSCLHFCEAYQKYEDSYKNFFEVIPVGYSAKLYFDLEFPIELNPDKDGPAMVNILVAEVKKALRREFAIEVSSSDVIKLDSTTALKFSQHVIFPNVVFRHLVHEKVFIERFCQYILNRIKSDPKDQCEQQPLHQLLVNTGREEKALFVDRSVYSRKQNFRIFQSRKFGYTNAMLRAPGELADKTDAEVLQLSLITNTPSLEPEPGAWLEYPLEEPEFAAYMGTKKQVANYSLTTGTGSSPFPDLDTFIANCNSKTRIEKWDYQTDHQILRFYVDGNAGQCGDAVCGCLAESKALVLVCLKRREYAVRCLTKECGRTELRFRALPEACAVQCEVEVEGSNIAL